MRGKSSLDAVVALAQVYPGAHVARIREAAEKGLREHPLTALFPGTHWSRDGRVVAKHAGAGLDDFGSEDAQGAIWAAMIRDFSMEIGLVVQGTIWPALGVLIPEHRLREGDFVAIADRSPIVPVGREQLFGKALFTGYDGDFATAIHLLVPQLEHMVRWHLKAAGVKTTSLNADGVENEVGLSALMELPETAQIFGEDLTFEIKAVFCDSLGPNLRNELAHGLLDYQACHSAYVVYAWWLGLRLVVQTFWNRMRDAGPSVGVEDGENEGQGFAPQSD